MTADMFPAGLALEAMGGRTEHFVAAYRVGYQVAERCPREGCGGNAAIHLSDLIDAGAVPPPVTKPVTFTTDSWSKFYGDRPPMWSEIQEGFKAGWQARKQTDR